MKIKLILVALVAVVVLGISASFLKTDKTSQTTTANFEKSVTLVVGAKVSYPDGLNVSLMEINDSRCKPDVQCIWAGELGATLSVSGGKFKSMEEIHLGMTTNPSVSSNGYKFTLNSATGSSVMIAVEKESVAIDGNGEEPVFCTQDAKQCPDGYYVGRTGPKCEFAPCPTSDGRIAGGYVAGHVTLGPNCPVEKAGEPCEPSEEAYTSREAVIFESNGYTERERIALDKKGNYKYALGPGIYWIQIQPAGIGPGEKKSFTVVSFQTTTVDFDIDTGIR